MPITGFQFPGVTGTTRYADATSSNVGALNVACIGPQYQTHNADNEAEAAKITTAYTPGSDVTVTPLPGKTATGVLDTTASTQHLVVKNGVFSYFVESTASNFSISNGCITFSSYAVKDGDGHTAKSEFGTRGAKVGDPIILTDGTLKATTSIIAITATSSVGYNKVWFDATKLGTLDPDDVTSVSFCEVQNKTYEQSATTFSIATNTLTIKAGLTATLDDLAGRSGSLQSGDMYIEYRERMSTYVGKLGSVESYSEIVEAIGVPCVDNPMALACYCALIGSKNSTVYFTAVDTDTVSAYQTAIDFLTKYTDIYSIVPCTLDTSIIQACLAACISVSEEQYSRVRRTLWYGINTNTALTTNPDRIANLISQRQTIGASERAVCVWADDISLNNEVVPNFAGAAAAAGMRCYEPCHRPLSNLSYTGFTTNETHGFTESQLRQLGAEGIWIIGKNGAGTVVNRRQMTTAVSNNLNKDEESIISNADDIMLSILRVGQNKVGCSNISPALLDALFVDISNVMSAKLLNTSGDDYIGPQLLSWELVSLYRDSVNKDKVFAHIKAEPPKPFNQFEFVLQII